MLVASVARESSGDSGGRMDVGVAPSVLGVGISVPTVDVSEEYVLVLRDDAT